MKPQHIPRVVFSLLMFVALTLGMTAPVRAADTASRPIASGDLIPVQPSMLNADGTLNLSSSAFGGALDLSGWDVTLDSKRGPVFSPAALPANSWSAFMDNGLDGPVLALAVIGSDLYVGGVFTQTYDGVTTGLNRIAKYDTLTNTWSALTDNGLDDYVLTLTVIGNDLYAGGLFTQTSSGATTGLNHIAKYNTLTNTWSAFTDNGLDNEVHALAVIGNNLYVGGLFTQTFGGATTSLNNIARYNTLTNAWSALTDNGLGNTYVASLAVIGNNLYVGGMFAQTFGGATTGLNNIAKYDTLTNTWSALQDNGLNFGQVLALAVIGNDLYVGGWIFNQTYGGATTGLNSIAKYNTLTNTWSALTDNGLNYIVYALAAIGNNLYVGGNFTQTFGGATTGLNYIARYNTLTNTWSAFTEGGLNTHVYALAVIGNDLYVGGQFTQTLSDVTKGLNHIARYTPDTTPPTVTSHSLVPNYTATGPSTFTVTFSENVNNPVGDTNKDDVTNPANYLMVNKGANKLVDTVSCKLGPAGDDTKATVSGVAYVPNTANVTLASSLPAGSYRLFVCGTTSIVDLAGNPLGGGVDYTFDFTVGTSGSRGGSGNNARTLPRTGFAPNMATILPSQPAESAYTGLGSLWIEIPVLKIKTKIVGVPQSKSNWDLKWLGQDAGWLNGTAFPTWEGNSVITAHVTDANGLPGPFADLTKLRYGDQIIIHLYGDQYIFEVRNKRLMRPETTAFAFEHLEEHSYLTLITCQSYDPATDSYRLRRVVRAVLVEVK